MNQKRHHTINTITSCIVILACLVVLAISFDIKARTETRPTISSTDDFNYPVIVIPNQPDADNNDTNSDTNSTTREDPETSSFIDLQPTVDTWLKTLSTNEKAAVMIYDVTNDRPAASFNADQVFQVASVYKLLFAYDGYSQIANGLDDPDTIITATSDKGTLTLTKCLDLIIRESYNGCADVLNRDPQRIRRVYALIDELDMDNTSNIGLNSTATDITKLLLHYWQHEGLTDALWAQISDSMLNQPPSSTQDSPIYDWRQGLPAGFSDRVKVYNKVGWDSNGDTWNIYADAAILDFTDLGRVYTAVVLTKGLSSYTKITNLGRMIEDTIENTDK